MFVKDTVLIVLWLRILVWSQKGYKIKQEWGRSPLLVPQRYLTTDKATENWEEDMSVWTSAPQLLQRGHCRAAVYGWGVFQLLRFSQWSGHLNFYSSHSPYAGAYISHESQGLGDQGLVELQPLWRGFQEGQEHQSGQFPWVNWQNFGNTWIWILSFASLASTGEVQKTLISLLMGLCSF